MEHEAPLHDIPQSGEDVVHEGRQLVGLGLVRFVLQEPGQVVNALRQTKKKNRKKKITD